jgi:hypothetical protein
MTAIFFFFLFLLPFVISLHIHTGIKDSDVNIAWRKMCVSVTSLESNSLKPSTCSAVFSEHSSGGITDILCVSFSLK